MGERVPTSYSQELVVHGGLLTNHHGVEVEAMESMEMAPGVNPCLGRVPEQDLLTPETRFRWRRHDGTFLEDDRSF